MVDESIVRSVRTYLGNLTAQGIIARAGVVFGSRVRGTANPSSDIDLVVVSAAFDGPYSRSLVGNLWRVAARTDNRIEPIPCGEKQWEEDQATPILEVARREGVRVEC